MKPPRSYPGRCLIVAALLFSSVSIPAAALATGADAEKTDALHAALKLGKARNVILLIGDGMGDSERTLARNYQLGAAGRLALDTLPVTGAMTTYSIQKSNPSLPDYVTDSAAGGTAIATGHKTYDGGISVLADGTPVPSILELARRAGYRTGDVSTAELQDATPAVFASHVVHRDCKGPQSMTRCPENALENGGAGSIGEQMVASGVDVMLGGGKNAFSQTIQAGPSQGKTVLDQAAASGYTVVTDAVSLASVKLGKEGKILGTFAPGAMDLEWTGPVARAKGTPAATCEVNPARAASQPHLSEMTAKAIDVLDQATARSKQGFFLHIEGASIDKQAHAANPCGQIGETIEFDNAVRLALDYQRDHPRTLVVVTADHANTAQIIESGSLSAGATATLVTKEGANMTISYATAAVGAVQQHTGTQLLVAAKGPRAAGLVGMNDDTDVFETMARALGVER